MSSLQESEWDLMQHHLVLLITRSSMGKVLNLKCLDQVHTRKKREKIVLKVDLKHTISPEVDI